MHVTERERYVGGGQEEEEKQKEKKTRNRQNGTLLLKLLGLRSNLLAKCNASCKPCHKSSITSVVCFQRYLCPLSPS